MKHILHDRLTQFLLNLECLGGMGQHDAFANEAIETGGTYVVPIVNDTWSTHLVEISLHGVTAIGPSEAEAITNWKRMARRHLDWLTEDDGFTTVHPPMSPLVPATYGAKP